MNCDKPHSSEDDSQEDEVPVIEARHALSDEVHRLLKMVDQHVADGGLALSRNRNPATQRQFAEKYVAAYLATRARPYYDEEKDTMDMCRYYGGIVDGAAIADRKSLPPPPAYDALNQLLFGTYKHANRRIGLWAIIDRQPDGSLLCAYSGEPIESSDCCRLTKADEEHLVPQSWHKGSKTHPGTDMHQIFIVSKRANGSRGNLMFGPKPATAEHGQNKAGGWVCCGLFHPHLNVGAVCRATLYTMACYQDTFHRQYFPAEVMTWIQQTAATVPVSVWERHRNAELFALQGNRNPFIDFPSWSIQLEFTKTFRHN